MAESTKFHELKRKESNEFNKWYVNAIVRFRMYSKANMFDRYLFSTQTWKLTLRVRSEYT